MTILREPKPWLIEYRKRIANAKRQAKGLGHTVFIMPGSVSGTSYRCTCGVGFWVPRIEPPLEAVGLALERPCEGEVSYE